MGNIPGSIEVYSTDALGLTPPENETLRRMISAYPHAVPYDRCSHLSTGVWASASRQGHIVWDLRSKLGRGCVQTVFGEGYRLGPDLVGLLANTACIQMTPVSSEEHCMGSDTETVTQPTSHSLRSPSWSSGPHLGIQDRVHSSMLQACGMALDMGLVY